MYNKLVFERRPLNISSSGRRYCLIGVGNIAATLDTIEHTFYNNHIAIKRARAREGSAGL
nr:MAG TPA: hypothetical protein [Bacteriophage sp.]